MSSDKNTNSKHGNIIYNIDIDKHWISCLKAIKFKLQCTSGGKEMRMALVMKRKFHKWKRIQSS